MHLEASELLRLERASSRDGRTDPGGFWGSPLGWGTLMPVTASRPSRSSASHTARTSRASTTRDYSFRQPIPGYATGSNSKVKQPRHCWTYWKHGVPPRRAVSPPPTASTTRLNHARTSMERAAHEAKATVTVARPRMTRFSSDDASIERKADAEKRAPDALADVEESSIAAATRLRRAASVDAAARVYDAAASTQAALKLCAHNSSVGVVKQPAPAPHRDTRPKVFRYPSETAPFATALMPGTPAPKAESRELGDFYADRRPHATRLMEHLLASSKLAAAERAARPSLRRNPNAQARPCDVPFI